MCEHVSGAILHAYRVGFNLAVNNHDKPLDALVIAHRDALEAIGFGHISFADAMQMIEITTRYDTQSPINQCDGCRRGLPLKNGLHIGDGFNDSLCCTKHLYL